MPTIAELKEQTITPTPVILFDCVLPSGEEEHWSTHGLQHGGKTYLSRVLQHNLFELRSASDDGIDAIAKISLTLANADSRFSQIARNPGFRGAKLTAAFLFFDVNLGQPASEDVVLFRGIANSPDEITESTLRLSFTNRLNLQRLLLPDIRIQKRCPWTFPSTAEQRQEALDGAERGKYSPFFRCGYSADVEGGIGNFNGTEVFQSCDYTRESCEQRGMFSKDSQNRITQRFGGIEFVPSNILVRSHGEKAIHNSAPLDNQARYNDFVPLNYGTVWIDPPIVFTRNDGNLTRMEVLLGSGEINQVVKVVVNDVDVPQGQAGRNMTATGWFNVVSTGSTTGGFNLDFTNSAGSPLGDPYGSMAYLSVVVPNRVNDGQSLPRMRVLLEGLKLAQYSNEGTLIEEGFTNNPAWVLLDLLRRSGWTTSEVDLGSFAKGAAYCGETITVPDLYGNATAVPKYQCNLALRRRKSAGDVIRGVRNASGLYLVYGQGGLLELSVEGTLALQHPEKPAGSNSSTTLAGGWPAYEFGDGTNGFSGILRRDNGASSVRMWSRSAAETPNRLSLEFQDQFNEYQQDSLSLVDVEDAVAIGREVSVTYPALGIPNFHQAARILQRQLDKSIRGNTFIQFETSVRAIGINPGDLITLTYLKEGFQRQPFRVVRIAPGLNHGEAIIEAQIHDDTWYNESSDAGNRVARRQPGGDITVPRPLVGTESDVTQQHRFGIEQGFRSNSDGSVTATLSVSFEVPRRPTENGLGIPYVSLAPLLQSTGGSLSGGETYYYAVGPVDSIGEEGHLSFVVRASIPSGTNTNTVGLQGLRFSPGAVSFHVYRGRTPQQLLRIATSVSLSEVFQDTGASYILSGPPDANFDHARFDWRLELHPEVPATTFGPEIIGSDSLQLTPNEFSGKTVSIVSGKGKGQERAIVSHTTDTIVIRQSWETVPDSSSKFAIAESNWRFGATGKTSPVEFDVPNHEGATIHISGLAVNAHGRESSPDLSPLTRWRILGSSGSIMDEDVPPPPIYGFFPTGQGTVELLGIGFVNLDNTRSIAAGTLTMHYWNELASPTGYTLGQPIDGSSVELALALAGQAQPGDLIQINVEVMEVEAVSGSGTVYTVRRGSHGSPIVLHDAGAPVYHLQRKVYIVPFSRNFFGSPASGSFSHPIFLPDVRLAASDLIVTNTFGNSETSKASFTATVDGGLRTLSGGQFTIQVEGFLAIQSNVAPPLIIEDSHSVRDIFAAVGEAPTGAPIELKLLLDDIVYASLSIQPGSTISNTVKGFGLPPLLSLSKLTLDITSVGQTFATTPGRDLTVSIRL